jgi:CheY-like chemotaxis protein
VIELPQHLVDQITAGRCVAFVGAGFAAPAVPAWRALLEGLAEKAALDPDAQEWVDELIQGGAARDLEAAAQVLQSALGRTFDPSLAEVLVERGHPERIAERRRLLAGIPFDAILTTNFDQFLDGEVPSAAAYKRVLRDPPLRWWDPRFWTGEEGAPIMKLHGEVGPVGDEVVFTQRDYRERLYTSPAYMTFLRSLFATNTVLYLGVSFTDAYLNELRSEVLAMLDQRHDDEPVAYALLADIRPHQARYLRTHEGLGVLPFDTKKGTDWSGFEDILRAIHDATNPRALLGRAIAGRTIVWADSEVSDTSYGAELLQRAAADAGGATRIVHVRSAADACQFVRTHGADLVLVDWPLAVDLLTTVRAQDLRTPTIVIARGDGDPPDRGLALSLGATDAVEEWPNLFREIVRIFPLSASR